MLSTSFKRFSGLALLTLTTITCSAAWQAPQNLSDAGQDAFNPQPSMDPSGNAAVVWRRSNGNNNIIQGSVLPSGGSWTAVVDISEAGQSAQEAELAIDGSGNGVAAWARINGVHTIIQSAVLSSSGVPSVPVDLSVAGQDAKNAQVSVDSAGNAVAVWTRRNGLNWVIQAASRSSAGSWSAPITISQPGQNATDPKVAIDASGNAVALWTRRNGFHWIVQGAQLPLGGSWTTPVDLSAVGFDSSEPEVGIAASGYAVGVWKQFDGSNYVVQGSSLTGSTWSAPVNISGPVGNSENPQIAVNATGNAVAIWNQNTGTQLVLQGASFPFGGSWSTPADISVSLNDTGEHQIAIDGAGNAFAVWNAYSGERHVIYSSNLPSGGAWSAPIMISNASETSLNPQVMINSAGEAIAVWRSFVGSNWLIQAAMNP